MKTTSKNSRCKMSKDQTGRIPGLRGGAEHICKPEKRQKGAARLLALVRGVG